MGIRDGGAEQVNGDNYKQPIEPDKPPKEQMGVNSQLILRVYIC